MPWKTVKSGSKVKVVNEETGRVMGTHPNKASANAQLRALYANIPEARNEGRKKGKR